MNLLVTGAIGSSKDILLELEKMGNNVIFLQNEKDELPTAPEQIEGIICNGLFFHHPIEKFINLKYIQLTSAGFDRVPMEYVEEKGIAIYNARGVYSVPMAEYAVCGVLSLYKQMQFFKKNQNEHNWEKHRKLPELFGKTVLIVGCGSVGNECAMRFKAFGTKVIGCDINTCYNQNFDKIYHIDELYSVLPMAYVVVLTLPLSDKTRHLIDEKAFSKFKDASVLVNISRGAVVDTNALINALENKLFGAVLDVFEEEPLNSSSPLWDMQNVIITPHNSFVGEGNKLRLYELILNNLWRYSK